MNGFRWHTEYAETGEARSLTYQKNVEAIKAIIAEMPNVTFRDKILRIKMWHLLMQGYREGARYV